MSIIWHKVWRDLTRDRIRTFLVVLSTAVGVFALGMVIGMSSIMGQRMTEDFQMTIPSHITFQVAPSFDASVVSAIEKDPAVATASATALVPFRWKLRGETEWRDGQLSIRDDYAVQTMDRADLLLGSWPGDRMVAVERQSAAYFDLQPGAVILVETDQREKELPVSGITRELTVFPPQFGGDATFSTTLKTFMWLAGGMGFNQLHVRLTTFSEEGAEAAAHDLENRLEHMGLLVMGYTITDPETHFLQDAVNAMLFILGAMGLLMLGLSAFLIVNTMNAIMMQQVRQIGVMKTIGATSGRVVHIYLIDGLIYGLLALLAAVPLGAIAAHFFAGFLLGLMNIDMASFRFNPNAAGIQAAVGLVTPVVSVLVPVIRGARITPTQAIHDYGLGDTFGRGRLDQAVSRIRLLPSVMALSLRNLFRRKVRAGLTLFSLVFSGAMFITVISINTSLHKSMERLSRMFEYDVILAAEAQSSSRLVSIAERVPGVTHTEVWNNQAAELLLAGDESRSIGLWGLPLDSTILNPTLAGGRWLQARDRNAIVLNSKIASDEGLRIGELIELTIGLDTSEWLIVGLVSDISNNQSNAFIPLEALKRESSAAQTGDIIVLAASQHDTASQTALMEDLRTAYAARNIELTELGSSSEERQRNLSQYNMIVYLMLVMVLLTALVGALGLTGTMSLNIIERTREIGVMRAIGATSFTLMSILVSEGILLGALSWLLATPLSIPVGYALSTVLGQQMKIPLEFHYSLAGMGGWLVIVTILAALASVWPAARAVRISVRESLAYEG